METAINAKNARMDVKRTESALKTVENLKREEMESAIVWTIQREARMDANVEMGLELLEKSARKAPGHLL